MQPSPDDGYLEDLRLEFKDFQAKFMDFWGPLPNKTFFLTLLGAWLVLFHFLGNSTFGYIDTSSLLRWMYNAYNPDQENSAADDAHGMLIPFVVLGLFWWKRKQLLAAAGDLWWPALGIVVVAVALHLLGYLIQQPRVSIIALFTGIYGFMGMAWGPRWLQASFFPFFLFAFCVPLGSLAEKVTFPLRLLVCQLVEFISNQVFAIGVVRNGTQLLDSGQRYQYEVAAACSGLRSLVAIFVMATVYGFVVFQPLWKRLLVVASAFPLAVLGNLARMMCIVFAAEIGGQKWGTAVHDSGFFSLVPYVPAILGLFWVGHLLGDRKPKRPPASEHPAPASS